MQWNCTGLPAGTPTGAGADPRTRAALGQDAFRSDVLATAGLDDRTSSHGYLSRAEELMADAVGAEQAFFSTCGSSLSVKAAMLAVAGGQGDLLTSRDAISRQPVCLFWSPAQPIRPRYDTACRPALAGTGGTGLEGRPGCGRGLPSQPADQPTKQASTLPPPVRSSFPAPPNSSSNPPCCPATSFAPKETVPACEAPDVPAPSRSPRTRPAYGHHPRGAHHRRAPGRPAQRRQPGTQPPDAAKSDPRQGEGRQAASTGCTDQERRDALVLRPGRPAPPTDRTGSTNLTRLPACHPRHILPMTCAGAGRGSGHERSDGAASGGHLGCGLPNARCRSSGLQKS